MDRSNSVSRVGGFPTILRRPRPDWPTLAMAVLAGAFLFRVLAQLLQAVWPVPALPPFEAWQGSGLPYPALLASQLVIVAAMVWAVVRRAAGRSVLAPEYRRPLIWVAIAYFAVMSARLIGGLSWLSEIIWFARPLPALFHLVLAAFLMILVASDGPAAVAEWRHAWRRLLRVASYPAAMLIGFALFAAAAGSGASSASAAMLAVSAGAGLVVLHELLCPYRARWRPAARELADDLAYLGLVQMLLPRLLGFGAVWLAASFAVELGRPLPLWPHRWPAPAQALLMVLTADLLRYWLHRAAHRYELLWRLHAVHHAPKRLYAINVARFHPLEKTLQFVLDALPFLSLGVGPDVLALYFVFYAINGFYQHSNCDIRLGPLNYVISGPELHRWHHSVNARESNNNYGNNLIVWDLLFGTYFRPRDREVGRLGLVNRRYPQGFVAQLGTPFVGGLDRVARG